MAGIAATTSTHPAAHRVAYAGLAVATLGWATAFIIGKALLNEMTPLAVALWRYAAAVTVLLPFVLYPVATSRPATRQRGGARKAAMPLAVMVIAGGVLYPWLFLAALARTSATNTSLLIALNPVITLLLVPLVGERLDRLRVAGAAVAFAGAVTVISHGEPLHLLTLDLNTGDLLALAAAACWASFNLASRPVVGRMSPAVVNLLVYGGGALAFAFLAERPLAQLGAASPAALAGILAMAILSSVLAGQLFLTGVRAVGVGRSVVFIYLVPVATALLAALLLDERIESTQLLGGSTVLLGLYWTTRGA